jgi:ribonuclease J
VEDAGATVVTNEDIRDMQERVILVASFYDMNEMVEIQPEPGSVYILSQSEPFNEEMEIDFDKLLNWLERWGIPLYNIHTSGHCLPLDLKETIRRIGARKVFLIHTEKPTLYKQYLRDLPSAEFICPTVGEEYQV